jgi:hypothetical protein
VTSVSLRLLQSPLAGRAIDGGGMRPASDVYSASLGGEL